MDQAVEQKIQLNLQDIATDNNVAVLLAVESGSRAWGFASQDSDYDVRFIYARPRNDYLRLQPARDVIELPIVDELDVNGWDLKKALGLLVKSNPPALEWLSSPIIYKQDPVLKPLLDAAEQFFDPTSTSHHYLSMALQAQKHLQVEKVVRKKYLYALRPLLCIKWIREYATMPPMEFSKLLDFAFSAVPDQELMDAIRQLLASKTAGKEIDKQPRDPVLDQFIEKHIAEYQAADFGKSKQPDYALADGVFLEILDSLSL